jgi:hypothetical protein
MIEKRLEQLGLVLPLPVKAPPGVEISPSRGFASTAIARTCPATVR